MPDFLDRLKTALADRYAVQEEIGAGGMATVYLAEDLKHHRKVAVKVLRPELAAVLGPERFLREIETTANLNHPHILPLFDSGEADGFLYYVMPYVEGESRNQTTGVDFETLERMAKALGPGLPHPEKGEVRNDSEFPDLWKHDTIDVEKSRAVATKIRAKNMVCFLNAWKALTELRVEDGLDGLYVEGWCAGPVVVAQHGWVEYVDTLAGLACLGLRLCFRGFRTRAGRWPQEVPPRRHP